MKTYRYYGKGFRTFRIVGYALLWVSAVILCAVVFDYLLSVQEQEEKNRIDAQIASGHIRKMPQLAKQKKNLKDCYISGDALVCDYTEQGQLKRIESK